MSAKSRIIFLLIFWIYQLLAGKAESIGKQKSAESKKVSTEASADYSYTPQEGSKTSSQEFYNVTAELTPTYPPLTSPQPCRCPTVQLHTTTQQPITSPKPSQCPEDPLRWVEASHGEVPPGAIVGGTDINNELTYIARASHEGSLVPGKLVPSHKTTYVSYGGSEIKKSYYGVLCGYSTKWVPSSEWRGQAGAVPAGPKYAREKLYICRAYHGELMVSGKLLADERVCYIPIGGYEVKKYLSDSYEILFYR